MNQENPGTLAGIFSFPVQIVLVIEQNLISLLLL